MYCVSVRLSIPLKFIDIEGGSIFEAVENVRKLIQKRLPDIVTDNLLNVQDKMVIALEDVYEVLDDGREVEVFDFEECSSDTSSNLIVKWC